MGRRGRLFLLAASLFLSLLVAEVALRQLGVGAYREQLWRVLDPDLGWALRPLNPVLPTNSFGIRADKEFSETRRAGVARVALFGDSVVFGLHIPCQETTAAQLGALTGAEALNFGVPGYGTDQALLMYRLRGRRFKPDYVCIGVSLCNDIGNNGSAHQYGVRKPRFELIDGHCVLASRPGTSSRRALDRKVRACCNLYNLTRQACIRAQRWTQMDRFCRDTGDRRFVRALRLTRALLEQFVTEVRDDGAVPVLVALPYRQQFEDEAERDHPLYREVLGLVDAMRVRCVDGVRIIEASGQPPERAFHDGAHLSAWGSGLFATAIAEQMRTDIDQE